jgi:prepilin-type N-terminal cleavage/methylation domain-containing protein
MVNLKRRKVERERGVTLIELMIVIGIMGIVIAAMYNMFNFQQKSYSVQDNVAVMQQNVRVGLEYMVKEIRMAGYIPEGIPYDVTDPPDVIPVSGSRDDDDEVTGASFSDNVNEEIEEATADSIAIQADVDNDGASEVVRYTCSYDAGESTTYLTRQTWRWDGANWNDDLDGDGSADGPQVIAEDIDAIAFDYALLADDQGLANGIDDDGDGAIDVNDRGELKDWDLGVDGPLNTNALRSYIRQVTVTLTARAAAPDSKYTHPQQGDHYRRKTLTSRIGLRNMK